MRLTDGDMLRIRVVAEGGGGAVLKDSAKWLPLLLNSHDAQAEEVVRLKAIAPNTLHAYGVGYNDGLSRQRRRTNCAHCDNGNHIPAERSMICKHCGRCGPDGDGVQPGLLNDVLVLAHRMATANKGTAMGDLARRVLAGLGEIG